MRSLAAAVEALFEPSSDRRQVGIELELLVYHEDRRLPVTVADSTAALAADPRLMVEANVSFEPGGQLELSPTPDSEVERLLERLGGLLGRVRRALAQAGLTPVLQGTDAWRHNDAAGLQKPNGRYLRMQEHFDRIGPWGRRMMRQTAGLQVCVSLEPGEAGRQQWRLANRMAPVIQAMFANSPALEGRQTGLTSTRSALWQLLDPCRTGFAPGWFEGDPVAAYLQFAASATRVTIATDDPIATHLSTLFPPVRPRGDYLELRCLDSVPLTKVGLAVRLISTLLHEPSLRTAALACLLANPLDPYRAWSRAARFGLADPELAATAGRLLEMAGLGRELELAA